MPFLSHSLSPLDSIPVGARADMGRQEADYVWKKTTENIQDVFEFVQELGSWVQLIRSCVSGLFDVKVQDECKMMKGI